ncbi:MAG TPA: hypothetical protein VMZ25_01650 [Terriglobales bacterium]|nr:hypothetical protein [Terriglobales bacterium]
MRSRFPAIIGALLLCLTFLHASTSDPLPKADEVLKQAIERAQWQDKNKLDRQWAGTQRSINQKLNKEGHVEETVERMFQPVLVQGKPFARLISKNGKPLSGDDQKKEAEREKKFRENVSKPNKADDDDDDVELNEELISRYNFNVIRRDQVGDRPAFLLTFLPRPNVKLPEKRKMDRILNRLEGQVWFDAQNYSLLKVDMHLTEPTTLMGGLGSIRSLDFLIEMMQVAPDVVLPREVSISFEGRQLFKSMRVKQKGYFTDYRKVSELAEAK